MKKIISVCLVFILIGSLLTFPACTKNTGGAAVPTQDIITEFEIGNEKIKLVELSLLSGKVNLSIPEAFRVMTDEEADSKYPVERRPTIIYTNENGTVNIVLSYTKDKMNEKQIKQYLESFKKSDIFPSAEWYDSGMVEINGKTTGYMEMLTTASDSEIYNLAWFTELDGIMLISSFNCPKEQMEDWKPIAKTIMNSQQCFKNSNTITPPTSSSREYVIEDYSIQVTCPDGWWQSESDKFDLQCLYHGDDLIMWIFCNYEEDLSGFSSNQKYFEAQNQQLLENDTNVTLLEDMTEHQYEDKTITSVLYSSESNGMQIYNYFNLVTMKDSDCILWVSFLGEPTDFEAGAKMFDEILQGIKSVES